MKFMNHLKPFGICLLIVGFLLALIGAFYVLVKAGTPAQDPTLEAQMAYLINHQVGSVLFWYGLLVMALGIMSLLLRKVALT